MSLQPLLNVFSDRLLSRSADGRLFHIGVAPVEGEAALAHQHLYSKGQHIQSMLTAVKDVLELCPPACRILADMNVRGHGYISI